jgi:malate dehydrogenase (oxaloacetate-decarboxylating)
MIIAAARRLASLSPALKNIDDALLPDFESAAEVNTEVAIAVAEQAIADGSANVSWGKEQARAVLEEKRWKPIYGEYFYDEEGAK